ncbi:hypothetical protein NKR23_g11831 [Pleurostoma richardsiae]|uniref:Uncharacterized protein n=1 Tax=Pleurostoma richardsiae TaxID=41990 RepID=A0AA38R990_9PEZI|nr:hypothetical protein NKR23_g11831 [Pleurostoma richardsiae]
MASGKRKRSASVFSSQSDREGSLSGARPVHLPHDSINPLSHSPGTLKQASTAGLAHYEQLPSLLIHGFPHRPLPRPADPARRRQAQQRTEDEEDDRGDETPGPVSDAEGEEDDGILGRRKDRAAERKRDAQDAHLGFLTGVVLRCLEEGDIERARRAFGLLRRSEVQGKPVDLRRNGLWALGAEILMREGEGKGGEGGAGGAQAAERVPRRWGAAADIGKVKTYFEGLIRQYPYNRLFPRSVSAVDFWPAMLGCEFYHIYTQHRLALERLEIEAETWEDVEDPIEEPIGYEEEEGEAVDELRLTGRERRLREEKDSIKQEILAGMRDVAKRMNDLMENQPYSTNLEMLRLRGMVALYMGDLVLPPAPRSPEEDFEGQSSRDYERDQARRMFRSIVEHGGRLDRWIEHFLDPDGVIEEEEEEEEPEAPMFFSSLPIRGYPT